jgi:hypothetical protein
MNAEKLLGLAERCEKAGGPDLLLDGDIHEALGFSRYRKPIAYTASLDAAMTLVPEDADAGGERFRLEHWNGSGVHAAHVRASAWVAGAARVYAATPALALTAAALRARAAIVDRSGEAGDRPERGDPCHA